jgi:hypothetical protein
MGKAFDPVKFGEHLGRAFKEMRDHFEARINNLEAQLEEARAVKYCGVWNSNKQYTKGQFVTHAGSVWHANVNTTAKPSESHIDWTLAVKRGKDGR